MKKEVKVSACIITYNQQDYIKSCLDGAIKQVLDYDYEIIIGDDCSTDNTLQICKEYADKYPNKIKLLSRTANKGMAGNWIDTIQNCTGKYIAICEGDDYWTDNHKLQKQVDFLEMNLDYVLCFHPINILKRDGTIVDDFITKVPENYETIETLARLGNYIHTPSVVYRNVISKFPFEFQITPIADYFLYMMLAEHGKLKYIQEKMAVYRYEVGVFSGKSNLNMVKYNYKFFNCLLSYLVDNKIKKIILERQNSLVIHLENTVENKYKSYFISNHFFFKMLKFINENFRQPSKIVKKIIDKCT